MGDWTRQEEHSWPTLDALTWPLRRWVCDRLVGEHAYSRNVALGQPWTLRNLPPNYGSTGWRTASLRPRGDQPFDQECT